MREEKRPPARWRYLLFFLVALFIIGADQASKAWIRSSLPEGYSLFRLGFFRITHVHNTGAAFGLFPEQSSVLAIFAIIAAIVVLFFVLYGHRYAPWLESISMTLTFGLVLGGTVGNLIDRFRFGYVTDFIDFGFWPTFNIADSAVTVGVSLFALILLRHAKTEKQ
ncbi:MAG: signal peptidase II [Dehalococcoidia bacterium]|nr:MAG: signal peptidase II [Dehalococcoidia bacterium]